MVGRCAMCGFDLGRGDDGELRKGGHDARSCEMKVFPCFNRLPPESSFYDDETCTTQGCAHAEKCTTCKQVGHHVRTLVITDALYVRTGNRKLPCRRRSAPELGGSDFACPIVDDQCVKEWVKVYHDKCWASWRERQRSASNAELLRNNLFQTGLSATGAADVMRANSIPASTNAVDNRRHFDSVTAALAEPGMSAVGAAMVAATSGTPATQAARGGRAGSVASATAPPASGVVAGAETMAARGGGQVAVAGRGRRDGAASGTSLVTASSRAGRDGGVTLVAARMVSQQEGDMRAAALRAAAAVRQMTADRSAATVRHTGGGGGGGPAAAAPAGGGSGLSLAGPPPTPDHLVWRAGQRALYDKAVIFSDSIVNLWSPVDLAKAVFEGAIGSANAQHFPGMEAAFVEAAKDHVLTGMTLTCGAVSPADVAEQLCYKRTQSPNVNVLPMIAKGVHNLVVECAVATSVVTPPVVNGGGRGGGGGAGGGGAGDGLRAGAGADGAPSRKRRRHVGSDVEKVLDEDEAAMSVGSGTEGE